MSCRKIITDRKGISVNDYINVLFSCISKIMELGGRPIKILMCCWKYSSFNPLNETEGNMITNSKRFKDYVRSCGLEISDASIDDAISLLCKNGFLIKICRGERMLNPEYFFKGTISQRSKLKLSVGVEPAIPSGNMKGTSPLGACLPVGCPEFVNFSYKR